jgi:hypothetical protein
MNLIYDPRKIILFKYESGSHWIESPYIGKYSIEIDSKKLMCKYIYNSDFYNIEVKWKISRKQYLKFNEDLIGINIFSWNKKYIDENICDGGTWSLLIKYNKNELFEIIGDSACPDNYEDLKNIILEYFPIIKEDNEYRKKIETRKW